MSLFKNGIGRPSNETIMKRRITYTVIAVIIISIVFAGGYLLYNNFFAGKIESEDKNATVTAKANKFVVQALDNNCYKIYAPTKANYWRIQLSYNNKTYKQLDHYNDGKKYDTVCFVKQKTNSEKHKISVKWTKSSNNKVYGLVSSWKPSGWKTNSFTGWAYKDYSVKWKNDTTAVLPIPKLTSLPVGDTADGSWDAPIELKVDTLGNGDGLEVYYSTSKTGSYKLLQTTKANTVAFRVPLGKTYYVKARIYKTVNGKKSYGGYSSVMKFENNITPPVLSGKVMGDTLKGSNFKLSVNYTADMVELYYATTKNGAYKLYKSSKKSSIEVEVPNNKTYYLKARIYKTVNGKKVYSGYSNVLVYKGPKTYR